MVLPKEERQKKKTNDRKNDAKKNEVDTTNEQMGSAKLYTCVFTSEFMQTFFRL